MKTRIISSIVGLALLAAVILLGKTVLGVAVFIVSVIAIHEFYSAFSATGTRPVKIIGYVACLPILALSFADKLAAAGFNLNLMIAPALFLLLLALSLILIFGNSRFNITDASVTVFGVLYIPFLFSFIPLTRWLPNGELYFWLIFIGAWGTDTFAYFTGVLIGKTKILPAVSPKKSLEGAVGGILGCILLTTVFGLFINSRMTADIALYKFVSIGLLCGIISQFGDWVASAIKRYVKIKDYGSIMPGHGGVLDRFDSIMFTAPVVYFYLTLCVI